MEEQFTDGLLLNCDRKGAAGPIYSHFWVVSKSNGLISR